MCYYCGKDGGILLYDSIYIKSPACIEGYDLAKRIADWARDKYNIIEKYDSKDEFCHLQRVDPETKEIIWDKKYKNRGNLFRYLPDYVEREFFCRKD